MAFEKYKPRGLFSELYGIPLALMASELVVNSAFGLMGYWLGVIAKYAPEIDEKKCTLSAKEIKGHKTLNVKIKVSQMPWFYLEQERTPSGGKSRLLGDYIQKWGIQHETGFTR